MYLLERTEVYGKVSHDILVMSQQILVVLTKLMTEMFSCICSTTK